MQYVTLIHADFQAHEGCLKILKYQPSNADVLEQLRLIYLEMNEPTRARILFQDAFDYCKANNPMGPDRETSGNAEFGLLQIIALADFYNNAGEYRTAVNVVRQGARWFDGRLSESGMWDSLADDREFDVEGVTRDGYPPSQIHRLDVNLRQRLAVSRLRLGELIEAEVNFSSPRRSKSYSTYNTHKMHASIVLSSDVREYSVLFIDLADAYFELGMYDEALRIYIELGAHEEVLLSFYSRSCHLFRAIVDQQYSDPSANWGMPQESRKL
jgi:general transcription factor 3C polypeptide 3 (transcription factor C subunit 4)